jgi:Fe-S oxidoreductase
VDVARFKSEFLADYWQRHGTPLKARALGHVRALSEWASRAPAFSNWWLDRAWVRALNERIVGIDRRRRLPRWSPRTLASQWGLADDRPATLIFNDTFTNYYHPAIGLAARGVLHRAGIRTALAPNVCCGRPLISQGLLAEARQQAAANTARLQVAAAPGTPLLFLEPSCLSAVREDVPALLRGDEQRRARDIAERAFLFEDYLERAFADGRARLSLRRGPANIFLHGHCHQKSMGLVDAAKALLARVPGSRVTDLDAGCCGMAGSFGYAREHFDISRQIGERRLLPAARGLGRDDVLVAAGTSCRQQVADFTGVQALHPAELLRRLI